MKIIAIANQKGGPSCLLIGQPPGEVEGVGSQDEFPPAKNDRPQPLLLKVATASDTKPQPLAELPQAQKLIAPYASVARARGVFRGA
jgi:hypothetical protein